MPFNETLAAKIRQSLSETKGLVEKKMFGGVAFLIDGTMCIGVHKDDLIVRCAAEETDSLLAKPGVRAFDLSGDRPMKGWILVGPEATQTAAGLNAWIAFAQAVPLRPSKKAKNTKPRRT